jgi:hypothetical protein
MPWLVCLGWLVSIFNSVHTPLAELQRGDAVYSLFCMPLNFILMMMGAKFNGAIKSINFDYVCL